jgi:hypothetical protein
LSRAGSRQIASTNRVFRHRAPHRGGKRLGEDHVDRDAKWPGGAGRNRLDFSPRPASMREDKQVEVGIRPRRPVGERADHPGAHARRGERRPAQDARGCSGNAKHFHGRIVLTLLRHRKIQFGSTSCRRPCQNPAQRPGPR